MATAEDNVGDQVPERAGTALLIVDMISPMTFDGADELFPKALAVAERIAALKERMRRAGLPVIYVNDNFGRWRSDFQEVVAFCRDASERGRRLLDLIAPEESDYFVLKPKLSGFYNTTLDTLLNHLGAERVLLAGTSGDICVLLTAVDAYLRGLHVVLVEDAIASISDDENAHALAYARRVLDADVAPAAAVRLDAAD